MQYAKANNAAEANATATVLPFLPRPWRIPLLVSSDLIDTRLRCLRTRQSEAVLTAFQATAAPARKQHREKLLKRLDLLRCPALGRVSMSGAQTLRCSRSAVWIFSPQSGRLWHIAHVSRKRVRILYSGNVQGVGFRYTAKSVATGFEVNGTVRNLADGRVELIAEGVQEELEAFRQAVRESGLGHFIRDEEISWGDSQGQLRGFEIAR